MHKKYLVTVFLCLSSFFVAQSQDWMESLDVAKRLARTQNKIILMVWEESMYYPFPAVLKDENDKNIFIRDLYASEPLMEIIWEYFIPVKVNELLYEDLFLKIKGKRSRGYIDKFNDDSIKVLDANGNIIGTTGAFTEVLNFSTFLSRYAINTSFISAELDNYNKKKDFYSSYYLASRYIDNSFRFPKKVRNEILDLSNIYLKEAEAFLENDVILKNKDQLSQLTNLTYLKQNLLKGKPRRVLKQLDKLNTADFDGANKRLANFLKYTAYRLMNKKDEFSKLESEISLVNLKLAQAIVNINR